ncbi:predicted protein [Plenodomus lingam JN3]|uniref:Predicted protein n=1 Tax=Leptosphaeria maculans (strain JN3 / isolate v23.1.3 / race Av1-4-5-6-7-8) TaxID=985895 RepID=E4ZLF8_LEPMJ|nr:predicted protein [Plenodomus lingam JN3]CBX92317.1 predicted protein [Plenodomus lingam JN3]
MRFLTVLLTPYLLGIAIAAPVLEENNVLLDRSVSQKRQTTLVIHGQ